MCTVKNPEKVIDEIHRVLVPGGKYLSVEHILADDDDKFFQAQQKILDPLQQAVAHGCHLTRETDRLYESKVLPQSRTSEASVTSTRPDGAFFRTLDLQTVSLPSQWPISKQMVATMVK
jgi:ubiquinone/menaquinone biosynthesis C-methylase UbiE